MISGPLARQFGDEISARESSLQRPTTTGEAHGDVTVVEPEGDFVTRMDTQLVAELLRDDDLTFRPNSVSHTDEYNLPRGRVLAPGGRFAMTIWGDVTKSPRCLDVQSSPVGDRAVGANQADMVSLEQPGVGEAFLRDQGFDVGGRFGIDFGLETCTGVTNP